MPILPGYVRVPGSAGRYRTPDGHEISRRQYENERIRQSTPYTSLSEFTRVKNEPKYQLYSKAWAASKGVPVSQTRKADSDFARQYAQIKKEGWNRSHDKAWARLLVDIGWRDESWLVDVGDSPTASGII